MVIFAALAGSLALVLSASAAARSDDTMIGDARVSLGTTSARLVEEVEYRVGVTRVADLVVDRGSPVDEITNSDLAAAWDLVSSVWPSSMMSELSQISVIDEGPRGLVGVVHRSVSGGWILSLDRSDLNDQQLVEETIIHEIAHVVTLSPDQFSFDRDGTCDGVAISVGCAASGSLMARWAIAFWPEGVDDSTPSESVDDYATTAPHEDLAETFTAWVAGWPVESSHVQARIDMLAADPIMNSLAAEIRGSQD